LVFRDGSINRCRVDVDFAYLGDFLLHLYYTAFEHRGGRKCPCHEELPLTHRELVLLKGLMGVEKRYENILEVEVDFSSAFETIMKSYLVHLEILPL
jgi:hypothetical protein